MKISCLTSVILWFLPCQLATRFGDVRHLDRPSGFAWGGQDGHFYLSLVLSMLVDGKDAPHTRVGANGLLDVHLGVVVHIDDVNIILRGHLETIEEKQTHLIIIFNGITNCSYYIMVNDRQLTKKKNPISFK